MGGKGGKGEEKHSFEQKIAKETKAKKFNAKGAKDAIDGILKRIFKTALFVSQFALYLFLIASAASIATFALNL